MERYNEVVGLPVIYADSAEKAGNIKDIFFCPAFRKVLAFLLDIKGIHIKRKLILLKDVISIGKDAVIVSNKKCITDLDRVKNTEDFKCSTKVIGLNIYSRFGENLGIVEDILFDSKLGVIEGVITSNGLFHDIMYGRNILPLFGKVEFSEENLIVGRESVDEMLETGGGLVKRLNRGNM